jgi:hypothetical protein
MRRFLSLNMFNVLVSALVLSGLVFSVAPPTMVSAAAQNLAEGGIQLQIIAPPAGAYVGVQFQFPNGTWANVDAWTGPLDPTAHGYVKYWVDPKDFGKGPFRWVVWDKQGGKVLAMSAAFYFPTYATVVGSIIDFSNPTSTPTAAAASKALGMAQSVAEGAIQLRIIHAPAATPYVGVQWQYTNGTWYDVPAWAGPLDPKANGYVRHWVDPIDFGKGPFRWVVWDKQGGNVLAMSAPFHFPTYATTVGTVIDLAAH